MKSFTTVRRGLDPAEVEQYIRELEATLSKKDQQLADYQKKENAITKAVVDAQLTAATVIKTANDEAEKLKQDAAAELEDVKQKATALRQKLIAFQQDYNRILQQYLVAVRCTDMVEIFDHLDALLAKLGTDKEELPPLPGVPEAVSYTHLDVYKRQTALLFMYVCMTRFAMISTPAFPIPRSPADPTDNRKIEDCISLIFTRTL